MHGMPLCGLSLVRIQRSISVGALLFPIRFHCRAREHRNKFGSAFLIGVGATLFTGRSFLFSEIRQLLVGLAAPGLTYTLGHFIGAILSS